MLIFFKRLTPLCMALTFGLLSQTAYSHTDAERTDKSPKSLIQLQATASEEVTADLATMQWFIENSDADMSNASNKGTVALNEALQKITKDPAVINKRTQINTRPNYNKDGKVVGWTSRADLFIEGTDFVGLSKAGKKISNTFAIAQVSYRLSDSAKSVEEDKLTAKAIENFKQKAVRVSQGFGFSAYEVNELSVREGGGGGPVFARALGAGPMSIEAAPMALEAGQTTVSVTVSGSIRLK